MMLHWMRGYYLLLQSVLNWHSVNMTNATWAWDILAVFLRLHFERPQSTRLCVAAHRDLSSETPTGASPVRPSVSYYSPSLPLPAVFTSTAPTTTLCRRSRDELALTKHGKLRPPPAAQRVPAEFAARLEPGAGEEEAEVTVLGPVGKVWRVELRWQDGACWLGNGWAKLTAALGIAAGWSVVLRRERRGVATLSAFDPGRCLARLCTPHAGDSSTHSVTCKNRPRFIKLLEQDDLEKMRIPNKFVQQHLTQAGSCISSQNAMIFCPLRKFWRVKLDHGHSDVLHGDDWPRFVTAHDLSEGNILLFRYEGNMVLSVEVFLRNGCLKEYHTTLALCTTDGARGPSSALPQSGKRPVVAPFSKKRKNDKNVVYAISAPVRPQSKPAAILPRESFTKEINNYALTKYLAVKGTFCASIGLVGACTIQLKTSMNNTRSWPVAFNITKTYGYIRGKGWQRFCRDNEVEEGDRCIFKAIEKMVWLVLIK
ncbi:putative B3 domain-containing protein Os06g0632500 [Lolium rigidum]|uniref:putative B3 domain-containing protein Os06g0632500 n=1 Tax=Lolium rigidum TaxID=89674 RepID=UPI001F5D6FCC|nr:putative B3 domain-containing protein Os06g0632500 [Lolium rigidum]